MQIVIVYTLFNDNQRDRPVSDEHDPTIRLKKKPNVITDDRGRRVWAAPVEPAEFELVSTMELQRILDSDDEARQKIEDAARTEENPDAVLAHNTENDDYEFVDADGNEEFSLVSTQMLFKILAKDNIDGSSDNDDDAAAKPADPGGGFDPYNSN